MSISINEYCFKMKYLVSRTGIKISIESLHKQMNLFQDDQFIHAVRYADHEIERRIPPVDKLVSPLFDDVTHLSSPRQHISCNITQDSTLFRLGIGGEELRETNLALPTDQDDEMPAQTRRSSCRGHCFSGKISCHILESKTVSIQGSLNEKRTQSRFTDSNCRPAKVKGARRSSWSWWPVNWTIQDPDSIREPHPNPRLNLPHGLSVYSSP